MPVDRPPRAAPGREPRLMLVSNMWPQPADASFGIFVAQQVDDLRALGLEIAVCFVDGRASRANYARGIVRLRQQLRRHRPDLVHAHHVLAGLVALAAGARRPGRPLLVTHHGIEVFEGWQAPLARWLTRRVDRSLVVSPAMARQLGLGPEAVLPCGVDLAAFAPGDRRAARTALGLPLDGPRVAWLGADRPEKRLALAVAAIERLRERRPEARLHRIGGLPPEAVPLQLQACDALLLCSTHEGSPQAVKEALAVGLPVVATAVGDLPELLAGLPGCAVIDGAEPDLAGALAAALARALASGRVDARARLAGYARPTIAAGLRAIYRDCLGWAPERGPEPAGTGEGASVSLAARRLRILILRQGYYPDDPRVRREVEALAARGHAVDLVCLRGPGQPARETLAGARVYRLPLARRRAGRLRYLWDYLAFFVAASLAVGLLSARRRYPLVQVNSLPDFLVWAAWPARLTGARVLLDLHELMPELFASKYATGMDHPLPRLLGRIETAAIRWSDASLAVSQPCLERYLARGAPAERFTVILNSADPSLFPPPATAGDARAAGPPASPAPLRIVSHGTLVERYGYDLLLAALARLLDEGLDLRLEILGAGEQRPALEAQARALGLGEHLTLVGFVPLDRVAERLAGADIGAVANRSDPFTDRVLPTKLMEYAALGIPALAPATPAVRAYFDAGMVQLFEPGDLDALTAALRRLALDPALRARLADAAMTGFVARHGWPRMAERYTALVERLAGEGDRPG